MKRRTENALYGLLTAATIAPIGVGLIAGTTAAVATTAAVLAAWITTAAADRNRRKTR